MRTTGKTPQWLQDAYAGQKIEGQPVHPFPQSCFCVGPQNGDPECPCRMRARSAFKSNDWLDGFEAGQKFAEAYRKNGEA